MMQTFVTDYTDFINGAVFFFQRVFNISDVE